MRATDLTLDHPWGPPARLDVRGLTKAFQGVHAVEDVSFSVEPAELVALIGPNGSGKTTLLDCVSGIQPADAGFVEVDHRSVHRATPWQLVQQGVIRTFQSVRVFGTLPVRQNLYAALLGAVDAGRRRLLLLGKADTWPAVDARARELMAAFGLTGVANVPAGELSYGQRKLVELATACMRPPRLLLLDEPVAGVNPTIVNVVRDWIVRLNAEGSTVVLVEHNIELVLGICRRAIVLDNGRKIADGRPETVLKDARVQEAYFGS